MALPEEKFRITKVFGS